MATAVAGGGARPPGRGGGGGRRGGRGGARGGGGSVPTTPKCRWCQASEPDHAELYCPKVKCLDCNGVGHMQRVCPKAICRLCHQRGHKRYTCPFESKRQRVVEGSPLVPSKSESPSVPPQKRGRVDSPVGVNKRGSFAAAVKGSSEPSEPSINQRLYGIRESVREFASLIHSDTYSSRIAELDNEERSIIAQLRRLETQLESVRDERQTLLQEREEMARVSDVALRQITSGLEQFQNMRAARNVGSPLRASRPPTAATATAATGQDMETDGDPPLRIVDAVGNVGVRDQDQASNEPETEAKRKEKAD